MFYVFNPYWWTANLYRERFSIPSQKIDGIYPLCMTTVQLSDSSVDYGINPKLYLSLPNESIVLIYVHTSVPEGGEDLPVTIVVPDIVNTTLNTSTSYPTHKITVTDNNGTAISGSDIKEGTRKLVYINKASQTIKILETINS